ncbi:MAG: hypothetical protein IPJ65_10810 [Archangiaceae bacterium]|nr:hypothetical protein [Archangiaceae bacterium]
MSGVKLQFGAQREFQTRSADVAAAARPLDSDGNGVLTLDEVKAGAPEQQREVFRALSGEFLERLNAWHAAPLPKRLLGLFHDPDRKAFLELAQRANDVGRLPEVKQRITTGSVVSVGYHDWSKDPVAG